MSHQSEILHSLILYLLILQFLLSDLYYSQKVLQQIAWNDISPKKVRTDTLGVGTPPLPQENPGSATDMNNVAIYAFYKGMQGLFALFACVGSGDPVRVLRLYTTNTLDTL